MAQYGQSQMSKAPNALDYLKKKEQEKKKFNLFDFSDVAPKPQLNFGPGMSGPGITNFQDLKASIPQQPTQPTQKSGFSLVPTANAMEEEDLLQQYLKDPKQDNNSKQQLFQALQDGESPESIINYLQTSGYKGNQPTQEQPGIFGKLKESAISSLPSPKAIGEVGLNILGGIEKNITGAVNIATSPFGVEPMRTPSETIRGVEKATPSLIERTIDNVLKGGEYQGEIWEGQINKEQGPESTTFQTLGNIGKTLIGDILGDAFISGLSTLSTKDQKEFAKQELEKLLNTKGAKYIQEKTDKINKDYEVLKEYDPGLARNYKAGKDIAMSFLDLIGFKATKSAGKITKETLENIPTNTPESIQKTGEVLTKGGKQVINKLTPDLQQKAYDISTKANRFVGEDIRKFYEITGESPGEFAVKRGMTKTGDEAVDEATKNWITSMKQADDALEQVGGNFKIQQGPDFIDGAFKGLQNKLSKYSPEIDRVNQLANKYRTEGLTMPEINEVKRLYASNHKYNWLDAGSKQATTSRDIQDGLRKWQFAKAKEMGLQNLDEINKNTQGWRAFADDLAKKLKRSEGNNNISLTDWVSLSGGNPTNIALFLGKKAGESAKFKELLIRKFGKQTKDAIIKPNINKPQIKGLLPQPGQTSKGPIVTPQTAEKGAILESKVPLKKTKYDTNNNIPSNMTNTRAETILKPNQPTNVSNKTIIKPKKTGGKVLNETKATKTPEIKKILKKPTENLQKKEQSVIIKKPLTDNRKKMSESISKDVQKLNTGEELKTSYFIIKKNDNDITINNPNGREFAYISNLENKDGLGLYVGSSENFGGGFKPKRFKNIEGALKYINTQKQIKGEGGINIKDIIEGKGTIKSETNFFEKLLPSNFKEKAQDLVDKVSEKTGAKMNLMPSGNNKINYKDVEKYYKQKTGLDDVTEIMDRFKKSSIENQQNVMKKINTPKVIEPTKTKENILENLNPTGGLYVNYTPEIRATAKLGPNITTLDKTMKVSPDTEIIIYRGAPKSQKSINAGDFVTTNYDLAKSYTGEGNILKMKVKAKDVLDDITEPLGEEYIYRPQANKQKILKPTNSKQVSKVSDDLINEARKFKSADEFIKAQNNARLRKQRGWTAPGIGNTSLSDVLKGKHNQPKDYFDIKRYDSVWDKETKEAIQKSSKTGEITIYRAVPKNINNWRDGEWVYFNENKAIAHGENALSGDYHILTKTVKNKDVWWDGNDINEWGYDSGKEVKKLKDIWKQAEKKGLQIPIKKDISNDLDALKKERSRLEREGEWDEYGKIDKQIGILQQQIHEQSKKTKPLKKAEPKVSDDLINEAKKYKSADEFIKDKIEFERGGEIRVSNGEAGKGIYMFPKGSKGFKEYYVSDKNPLVYSSLKKGSKIEDLIKRQQDVKDYLNYYFNEKSSEIGKGYIKPKITNDNWWTFGDGIESYIKERGLNIDGYIVPHKGYGLPTGKQVIIKNEKALNTISDKELKQIYEQSKPKILKPKLIKAK